MAASQDDMFSFCVDTTKVSSCVEVRFIDTVKGKGLFAKAAIKKGDTIFVERPLVSSQFLWNSQYNYKACDYCLRALETAEDNARRLSGNPGLSLPHTELCKVRPELHQTCPQCQVMYCSNECRQAAADQYHRALCLGPSQEDPDHPVNKLKDAWRSMHYPPETSSIMLMARMVATVKQFCSRAANEEEEIAHKLLGEKFQGHLTLLRALFTTALYDDHLNMWFTPEGFHSIFALVGTNGQGIETGDFLNCEGSGLFLLQSSCNHSCIPKAEAAFPNNNFLLHLSALSDISPGEEICISYLDCCQHDRSRHSRQKILRENYLFICSCPKCVSQMDELDLTSSEEEEEEEGDDMEEEITDV